MGNKGSKKPSAAGDTKPVVIPSKTGLSDKDYAFLTSQTGLSKADIQSVYEQFKANNPDERLDRAEFIRLYDKLRPESQEAMDEISQFVFGAFDTDNSGTITFNEFLVAYALTSRGDLKKKLEYAFALYDQDDNGSLTSLEVRSILVAMLDMLGAEKRNTDVNALVKEVVQQLDANRDGNIGRDEFINGLMANYSLRALMSPFN